MAKKNTLAWRIKDLRKHKGLTQKQLASELGISSNSVIDYENGRREPNAKALVRLEQFFGHNEPPLFLGLLYHFSCANAKTNIKKLLTCA